jgi:F0F1-type ATP synthase alpha subunit
MIESGFIKNELLKQPKSRPYSLALETCILLAVNTGYIPRRLTKIFKPDKHFCLEN